jgi:hypothetical protein
MCSCGSIFVDGGTDYIRRGGDPEDFDEEYDRLHGIKPAHEEVNEDDEQEKALRERAMEIDRKYGSPMLKMLVEMIGEDQLMNIYVDYVRCSHRAHKLFIASRVIFVLTLASMIASFFILSFVISSLFLLVLGVYTELVADSYKEHALHQKNVIVIQAVNHQVNDLTDTVEQLSKKGKRNVGRPRKTQRKKA